MCLIIFHPTEIDCSFSKDIDAKRLEDVLLLFKGIV
jgi:hypothetical protein